VRCRRRGKSPLKESYRRLMLRENATRPAAFPSAIVCNEAQVGGSGNLSEHAGIASSCGTARLEQPFPLLFPLDVPESAAAAGRRSADRASSL
jgi:hypothetical protein